VHLARRLVLGLREIVDALDEIVERVERDRRVGGRFTRLAFVREPERLDVRQPERDVRAEVMRGVERVGERGACGRLLGAP